MTTASNKCVSSHWQTSKRSYFAALCVGIGATLASFLLFAGVVSAQEGNPFGDLPEIGIDADQKEDAQPEQQQQEEEQQEQKEEPQEQQEPAAKDLAVDDDLEDENALADEQVTRQDLGAKDARVLPDSPLHFLKRFGRRAKEAVTFNPIKKAEVKLQHATQELYEAKKMAETKGVEDKGVAKAIIDATDRAEKKLGDIAKAADKLKAEKATASPAVDNLLERVLDKQIKHEKVLDVLEDKIVDKADDDDLVRFKDRREKAVAHVGKVLTDVEDDAAKVAEKLDKVFSAQRGSDLKDFKNIEMLKKLEDNVPEGARQGIALAQEKSFVRLQGKISEMSEGTRADKLASYTKHVKADKTRLLEITDELKQFNLPEDVLKKIEEVKDIAAARISKEMERMKDRPDARNKFFFERLSDTDDLDDLRVMEEMKSRLRFEDEGLSAEIEGEMKRHQEEGVKKFMATFTDDESKDQATRFAELSRKMAENPDPKTMKLLMDLENEVRSDPAKAKFISQMEDMGNQTRSVFEEKARRQGDYFMDRMSSADPRDLEIMRQFKSKFEGSGDGFDFEKELGEDFFDPRGFGLPSHLQHGLGDGQKDDFLGGVLDHDDPRRLPPLPSFRGGGFDGFDPFAAYENKQKSFIKEHVSGLEDADAFASFQKRFQHADEDLVGEFQRDDFFKRAFNDKATQIAELELRREEEDVRRNLERKRAEDEVEFFSQFENATEEERRELIDRKQQQDEERLQEELGMRRRMFEKRSANDPFCDDVCKQEMSRRFDKSLEDAGNRFHGDAEDRAVSQLKRFEQFDREGFPSPPGQENRPPSPFDIQRGGDDHDNDRDDRQQQGRFPGFPGSANDGAFPGQRNFEGDRDFPGRPPFLEEDRDDQRDDHDDKQVNEREPQEQQRQEEPRRPSPEELRKIQEQVDKDSRDAFEQFSREAADLQDRQLDEHARRGGFDLNDANPLDLLKKLDQREPAQQRQPDAGDDQRDNDRDFQRQRDADAQRELQRDFDDRRDAQQENDNRQPERRDEPQQRDDVVQRQQQPEQKQEERLEQRQPERQPEQQPQQKQPDQQQNNPQQPPGNQPPANPPGGGPDGGQQNNPPAPPVQQPQINNPQPPAPPAGPPPGGGLLGPPGPPPGASNWQRIAVSIYNFITLPARAFGL